MQTASAHIQTLHLRGMNVRVRCERLSRYRGEDETLGPGVRHLDLLQGFQHGLHLGGVAPLRGDREGEGR